MSQNSAWNFIFDENKDVDSEKSAKRKIDLQSIIPITPLKITLVMLKIVYS